MDTRTLVIALLAHDSLLGILSIYFGLRQTGTRALGVWGAGLLLVAAGLGGIALRGVVPDLLSISVANTLAMAANLFFYRGLRIFKGKSVDDPLGMAALVATAVLVYVFSEVTPSLGARVVVVALIGALFLARNALELGGDPPPAEVRVAQRFMQFIYWLAAALLLLRAALNLNDPGTDLMAPSTAQSAYFLSVMLLSTAGSFGMFWMEIQTLHLELVRQAARDPLTGLLNRRGFLIEFERELARVRRGGTVLSLAMFDLDHFKRLNDTYGHPAGDAVLRGVARSMQASVRQPDILGRYGGEEFTLLMPDTDAEMAMRVAERIRAAVQTNRVAWNGQHLTITISGGVAAFARHGASGEALVAAADTALYAAKNSGRNQVLQATPGRPAGVPGVTATETTATDTHATPQGSIRSPL